MFFSVHAAPPSSAFGVWDRGSSFDPKEYPYLKGIAYNEKWSDIERLQGVFNWSSLDKAMETAVSRNQFIFLSLGVGPDAPEWIYTQGVPSVYCNDQIHDSWPVYPFYPSQAYKTFFQRLITEFGKHIHSYPKEKQERIVFIQVKTGCTGDECAYKGNVIEKKYDLPTTSPAWREFRLWVFDLFVENFQKDANQPKIALMFNNVSPDSEDGGIEPGFTEEWNWVMKNAKGGVGIKIAGSARGHHLSEEKTKIEMWQPRLIATEGTPLFARSEMDQTWQRAMFAVNLPLTFYWAALTGLQNGQSIWDISAGAIQSSKSMGFDYSFYFFNKYAGQIYPKSATDAFCALHKGLDAADTKVYPEDKFGQARRNNVDRMLKICAAYSKQGAAVDDTDALLLGQVRQRDTQKGLNDVGWDIWPDNFGRFLDQIDPDATSIPLWRVGGPITKKSSIYSRFARGFEHATGKDALYFKLHEGFSQGNKPKVMTIAIVWYDSIKGSTWNLVYDAGKPQMKTALTVTGNGDQQWHHETVTINDAVFRYNGTKGSDFAIINTDAKDDIFSLIEVHRGKLESPVMLPPTDYKVSDKAPMPPKADKSGIDKQTGKKQKISENQE
ncbi:MAG: T9SS C-terminal target domain-containing protein [Bacteroidia bacterium]|nr:T9SS C-terminal target domain-containing protein [Bacteroidia bacterium]